MFKIRKKEDILNNTAFFIVNSLNNLKIARVLKLSFDTYMLQKRQKINSLKVYSDVYLTYDVPYQMNADMHRRNLEYMIRVADKNKCMVLVCNYHFAHRINNFLSKFVKQRNIPFCDNESIFREYKKKYGSTSDLISSDGWHPSIKGYSIIAHNLYETMMQYNLVQ